METGHSKVFYESCAMNGGEGPNSYAQNSTIQKRVIDATKKFIHDAIADNLSDLVTLADPAKPFAIADMGCATGQNAFLAVHYIIEEIENQHKSKSISDKFLEFQVFFNDLPSNDFNTLFKMLPPNKNYFAAAVAGSFYGRLFPESSLHFVYSSSTLHWLTRVPKEITNGNSKAFNKGRIHCAQSPKAVVEAYANQHRMDLEAFLNARAQEVVTNGLMALQIPSRADVLLEEDMDPAEVYEILGSCLVDMAKEGLLNEEKVDCFNVPIFYTPVKDVKSILERHELFVVERIEPLNLGNYVIPNVQTYVKIYRAVLEGLIENHFGGEIVDELFDRFTEKLLGIPDILDPKNLKIVSLFVLLKRKP